MRLILVRHGETDWNLQGRIQGITDTSLNDNGINAAMEFAESLDHKDYDIKAVYTSPLKRAYETGKFSADRLNVPIRIKQGLTEIRFGLFEGLSWDQVRAKYPEEYSYWHSHREFAAPPEGESYSQKSVDSIAALKEIIAESGPDDDVLVVSHSATIKAILCPLRHVEYKDMLKAFPLANLAEYVLEGDDIDEILKYDPKQ